MFEAREDATAISVDIHTEFATALDLMASFNEARAEAGGTPWVAAYSLRRGLERQWLATLNRADLAELFKLQRRKRPRAPRPPTPQARQTHAMKPTTLYW